MPTDDDRKRLREEAGRRLRSSRMVMMSPSAVLALLDRLEAVEVERDAANLTIESITAPHCEGCGAEVDPTTCWCGSECDGRDGHPFVEMGCNCMRDKNSEDWQRIATNLRVLAWHRKQALAASQQRLAEVERERDAALGAPNGLHRGGVLIETVQRETAERIAAWLEANPNEAGPSLRASIRAGAWRKESP